MKKVLFLLALTYSAIGLAQETEVNPLEEGDLISQYDYIIKKSGNTKDTRGRLYKVVRYSNLEKFKQNTLDSVLIGTNEIKKLNSSLTASNTEIESLKNELATANTKLKNTEEEKDSMAFLGAPISKANYKGIVWSIIFVLLGALGFFIYKFRNSNYLTRQAKSALDEMEKDFEQHKRRALEKEQKLSRELLDERNKKKTSTVK